jgi:hypothetical protein
MLETKSAYENQSKASGGTPPGVSRMARDCPLVLPGARGFLELLLVDRTAVAANHAAHDQALSVSASSAAPFPAKIAFSSKQVQRATAFRSCVEGRRVRREATSNGTAAAYNP